MVKTKEMIDALVKAAVFAELDGCDFLATFDYAEIQREYNGIGPEWLPEAWRAKASDMLELFAPAALIHDMRYSASDGTRFSFNSANIEFRDNCLKLANDRYPWYSWKRYRARAVALLLFDFVASPGGWVAWMQAAGTNGTTGTNAALKSAQKSSAPVPVVPALLLLLGATLLFDGCMRIVTIEKHDPKPVFDSTGTNVVDYVDGGYDFRYRSIGLVTDVDGIEATKDEKGVAIKVKNLKTDVSTENKEIVGASGTAVGNVVEKAIQGAKK